MKVCMSVKIEQSLRAVSLSVKYSIDGNIVEEVCVSHMDSLFLSLNLKIKKIH